MTAHIEIPAGFVKNAAGHLVPEHQVRDQDKLRDNVARDLAAQAVAISESMAAFKAKALADIEDLISISLERYGVKLGGMNVPPHIESYVAFSPRIAVAKVADAPTALALTSFRALTRAIALQEDSSMTSETLAREARSNEILLASRISEAL